MEVTRTNTRYGKGSIGDHAAVPPQASDGEAGHTPAGKAWVVWSKRIRAKVKLWKAQIHRYYLKLMRKHVALTSRLTFGYVRLITFVISVSRRLLFRKPALPYGAINVSAHDRRYALFRRRAVGMDIGCFRTRYRASAAWLTDDRLTNTYFKT
ncbi:hypothetical protein [Parapedobacter tibetensis]|uniref:hypothetical protein n=1 Tax=Parapedobacter tibetensis TaxID=2972951 RepID=UPI00214D9D98|nr:hypothetical protein [Parapedobacter tibetensis]